MPEMKSLTVNGVKYDVRDTSKAPAGYGLGTHATAVSDFNEATATGWYSGTTSTANKPFGYSLVHVINRNGTEILQIGYDMASTSSGSYAAWTSQIRRRSNNVWSEWEYVNPPMYLGVEYRTTERCEGKPVYAKRINCYAAPASVSISNLNIEKVVRWSGFVAYYGVALPTSSANWKVEISRTNIITTSAYEQASAHFYIDLYYTKA